MTARSFAITAVAALCGTLLFAVLAAPAAAHPGGLNAEGCHTNRKTGEYHCHRGGGAQRLLAAPRKKPACSTLPRCVGCGCKGGPGYRNPATGKCVGYKQLTKQCGNPPTTRCIFENAGNSGANRSCVLGE
jgi:hypothetical protein